MGVTMRFAIDTGGTFTDLAVEDDAGKLHQFKAPTTPSDPILGLLDVLGSAAKHFATSREELLGRGEMLIHGTTRAINAVVTGTVARTAFFTTWGHPEILVNREGGKEKPFDSFQEYPEPYVPRSLTFEIPERIAYNGDIVRDLDEQETAKIILGLRERGVEAVGVCLLFSTINPAHELRVGALLSELVPEIPYTLSHRLNPILREYRRASATVIDASLKPVMSEYLRGLERRLREAGFAGRLLVSTSNGGVADAREVADAPIHALNSGPAMAPIAGRSIAASETGHATVVVADTGGTTYDVSVVQRGRIPTTVETWIGPRFVGHMTGFPSVDVRSVGAGGGSIAWVDKHGLLHVGPRSAGADPGPICYGRGGQEPTVTDACLVLGYLDSDYFLGGDMKLDAAASQRAIAGLGERLGLDTHTAAYAVLQVATENMVQAIGSITIDQGIDPADAVLIGGGGAAGLNASIVGRRLGCDRVIIPQLGGVLSAVGMLLSDLTAEYAATFVTTSEAFDLAGVNEVLSDLERRAQDFVDNAGRDSISASITFSADTRYPDQIWELPVVLKKNRFVDQNDVEALRQGFHDIHHEVFAVNDPESAIEVVGWRVRAECRLRETELSVPAAEAGAPRHRARDAWFPDAGLVTTPVVEFSALVEEEPILGPVVVESPLTTVVVDPGAVAVRSRLGNLVLSHNGTKAR
jgi:N-methylhydantoinase A